MSRRKDDPGPPRPDAELSGDITQEGGTTAQVAEPAAAKDSVAPAPAKARVKWHGPGNIAIGGIGNLQPGETVTVNYSMARDLARTPGFKLEE